MRITRKFIQITTGEYSYEKLVYGEKKQFKGHCLYALDNQGQIWKWAVREDKGRWAKFEDCKVE